MSLGNGQRRRKRLSMTSLIDVIFLLLLFFMLSSTFTRFAEVEISAAGSGNAAIGGEQEIVFVRLTASGIALNGEPVLVSELPQRFESGDDPASVLIAVGRGSTAQMLTDVLASLRSVPGLSLSVLEAS